MSKESKCPSFVWFALLWAVCCVAHYSIHMQAADYFSANWWLETLAFLGGLGLLYRPTIWRFLAVVVLQILQTLVYAPFNPDHMVLVFFLNVAIVASAIQLWRSTGRVDPAELMQRIVPVGRWIFLICYGFAAIAKYNTHFLSFDDASCSNFLLGCQADSSSLISILVWPPAVPWVTLICETLVPVLLCVRRWRKAGIVVGLLFHALLVAAPAVMVFDFTAVVYMMLFLFTPPSFSERLEEKVQGMFAGSPTLERVWPILRGVLLVGIGAAVLGVSLGGQALPDADKVFIIRRWCLVSVLGTALIGLFLIALFAPRVRTTRLRFRPTHGLHYVIIVLALLNGASPYLGLKTQGSFTMFSNLRTEAGVWNHTFMPAGMRVCSQYQDRLVNVLETSDARLNEHYLAKHCLVPEFEVRRSVLKSPELSLSVVRAGRVVKLDRAGDDEILGKPLSVWERKLMIFRGVTPDGSIRCGH